MKTIVIVTGPLGSDLEFFNTELTTSREVCNLTKFTEITDLWDNPAKFVPLFDWNQSKYYITSVGCPNAIGDIPKYFKFINEFQKMDFRVAIAIVGDYKVLRKALKRKKLEQDSLSQFQAEISKLTPVGPLFVSRELAEVYGKDYLQFLQNYLKIPVLLDDSVIVNPDK